MGWSVDDVRAWMRVPQATDDKYARGVVGFVTGSDAYPGAAVLGVEAAHRAGAGMVRYVGPRRAADHVLARRPETVAGTGRVQAWALGSGTDASHRSPSLRATLHAALAEGVPGVLDAGALDLVRVGAGPRLLTPHAGELRTLLAALGVDVERAAIAADPERWAREAATRTGATVLLKGARTVVTDGDRVAVVEAPTHWLATAGTGDVLAGIAGALLAAHADAVLADAACLVDLGATAAWLHGEAGARASLGGPLVALEVAEHVAGVVRTVLADAQSVSDPASTR
ncbi:ADP-dependent NAD(P)H-hydrate dehydratase [Agrococcus jejuensis]|uniref:ADP-dependent (S)-NAD(P)H-hydrate dehydratase n=1 Tax=Agrococcus jejuensis TaxID=399736 RepID=A0A1G7ZU41_9MICO|nr:ADP/ATP-dependent (S)-NAD(P)H-hydrate dehydratase [Agrococcus jejuensis]SDH12203.1 yjeF C-terminal region, hydroxyethylthiazole kinase-related [Agrococcus jejuensis]